jgi:hypothetical protein
MPNRAHLLAQEKATRKYRFTKYVRLETDCHRQIDVVLYSDLECKHRYAIIPFGRTENGHRLDRRSKKYILNCVTWNLHWLPNS